MMHLTTDEKRQIRGLLWKAFTGLCELYTLGLLTFLLIAWLTGHMVWK